MDELGFAYVFSPIYSPQFNGVEEVFAIAKKIIKGKRLEAIVNRKEFDLFEIIRDSFESINVLNIKNCIEHSYNNLSNA